VERIFNIARDQHNYRRAQINPDTIHESMIVKHFYRNVWQLGYDWDNTDHVFGAPDPNVQVEQNEKSIAASLEISDDEQDEEEEGEGEDEGLSLPPHRHTQNMQTSPRRKKRAAR
jgi:hypothetical protein